MEYGDYLLSVFQVNPTPLVILWPSPPFFKIENVNEAYCLVTNTKREALVGKDIFEVFPDTSDTITPSGVSYLRQSLEVVAKEGTAHQIPMHRYDIRVGDPVRLEARYWETKNIPIRNKQGEVELILHCVTDITDSVLSEDELHTTKDKLRSLVQKVEGIFWEADIVTHKYVFISKQVFNLLGYTTSQWLGKPDFWQSCLHPQDRERTLTFITEKIAEGSDYTCEYRLFAANGDIRWIQDHVSIVSIDAMPILLRGLMTDVTDRKNSELRNKLLQEVNYAFNRFIDLEQALEEVLQKLMPFKNFGLAEVWLVGIEKKQINLYARTAEPALGAIFYQESNTIKSFLRGEGLPGKVWDTNTILLWKNLAQHTDFVRKEAAEKAGLTAIYGLPLLHNTELIGVLVLGVDREEETSGLVNPLFIEFTEYLAAEIKRKKLEQELTQVFNTSPDIICIVGPEGRFTKVNPAFCKLMECEEEELTTIPFASFIYPIDLKTSNVEYSATVLGSRHATDFVNRYLTKSGKVKWIAWNTAKVIGEESHSFAYGRDITETKQLQDLVDKATKLAKIGGWEIDLENNTVFFSKMVRDIHEVDEYFEPTVEAGIQFYRREFQYIVKHHIEQAMLLGTPWDFELPIITAKGNERWVRSIGEAEYKDDKVVKILGSFQDIHDRKSAEERSLKILLEKNDILESISDAFFSVDKNWVVTYWNKEAEKVLGRPKAEILNKNLWEVYADAVGTDSYIFYNKAIHENTVQHFETFYETLGKWYEVSAYPSKNGLSIYFKDVSERKYAQKQQHELHDKLAKQANDLLASNAELEQFAYVASHDLQEPLRMVSTFISLLEKRYEPLLDEDGKQYIHFAVDGAKRMQQLILELLEFSRVGKAVSKIETVDLNEVMEGVLILFQTKIAECNASVQVPSLPSIQSAQSPMRQVFHNLIGNALKYQKPEGKPVITIGYSESNSHWKFWVQDNGIGIRPEFYEKIFVIFQRLHHRKEYAGIGMGLSICKKIVQSLGGEIWVESEEGVGSIFYFTIAKLPAP